MKPKMHKDVTRVFHSTVLSAAAVGIGLAASALAQGEQAPGKAAERSLVLEEVIVTARRREETLQDVPISMSVFNQDQLDQQNVFNSYDLATYTPSLTANNRFGPDQAAFSIRGFSQELRTTASVGFYFADVVAPRGGGSVTAGDGAGPGRFFDLQNVQVLKGPQGTLFGRNTTGGAIMLVPQKPTDRLEGYVQVGAGNYDMVRGQAVVNVPISERARARFGVDYQKRDGYLKNRGLGPSHLADVEYAAGRASLVLDVTDVIENYTILTFTDSENNGIVNGMFACNPGVGFSSFCQSQLAHQGDDFFTVESGHPNPESTLEQWQAINTTTWTVSEKLTVKNILSYSELEQNMRTSVFGTNFPIPAIGGAFGPAFTGQTFSFTQSDQQPGVPTNSQKSIVEEIQFQGLALEDRLTWQAGLYYENSKPDGTSGSQSVTTLYCTDQPADDPSTFSCQDFLRFLTLAGTGTDPGPLGNVQRQIGSVEYTNKAVYSQATYDLTEALKVTAGLRYTWDNTQGESAQIAFSNFPSTSAGPPGSTGCVVTFANLSNGCETYLSQESQAPTWLLGLDYLPVPDALLYAKYARGYRQGSVNIFGAQGFRTHDEEEVDSYEIGAKTEFGGRVPGKFNIALFYNELTDQQIQMGFRSSTGQASPTTGIVNAGESTIRGAEIETLLSLREDLTLHVSYAYIDTELKELDVPTVPPGSVYDILIPASSEGEDAPFAPENGLTATLTYLLPVPESVGQVSAGVTYVYTDEMVASSSEPFGVLSQYELFNFNLSWNGIFGSPFDASAFVTNAKDEEFTTFVPGLFPNLGAEFRTVGEPRMWGVRLKYSFGQ